MKILIGCDESSSIEKLYYDFKRAGFPDSAEICVISVADVITLRSYKRTEGERSPYKAYLSRVDEEIENAQKLADHMAGKLKLRFPHWRVHSHVAGGSPAQEILKKAKEWKADLIVVGSHGRTGVGELFFGSVALKVMAGASSSVRIVRRGAAEKDSPSRIIIGLDGSPQNENMINQITARHWREGSSVHLITAINLTVYPSIIAENFSEDSLVSIEVIPKGLKAKKEWRSGGKNQPLTWINKMHAEYKLRLQKAGLNVSSMIKEGDPKVMLAKEAARWGADCIYVAALGHSKMERFFVGSVSAATAARAHCSVEVVR